MNEGVRTVYELVDQLAKRRGWDGDTAIHRNTGLARTSLSDWAKGEGGKRRDAFQKAEEAFDLKPGTLARVRDGHLTVDQVLDQWDHDHGHEPATTSLRAGTAPTSAWHQFAADATAVVRGHEAVLLEMLDRQLRNRGLTPELPGPDDPPADRLLTTGDGRHVFEAKVAGDNSDQVWAAIGQLDVYAGRLDPPAAGRWLVLERPPTADEAEELAKRNIVVVHPDDWSPLDRGERQPDRGGLFFFFHDDAT